MSSGKQTSFQFGEVAPVQHYRSNDAAYSNALHTLNNMYVRRSGGVDRRIGSKLLYVQSTDQDNIPRGPISYQRYKFVSYPYKTGQDRGIYFISLHIKDINTKVVTINVYKDNFGVPVFTDSAYISEEGNLSGVNTLFSNDTLYIHGLSASNFGTPKKLTLTIKDMDTINPILGALQADFSAPQIAGPISRRNIVYSGTPAYYAVQYLVTLEMSDGREVPFKKYGPEVGADVDGFYAVGPGGLVLPGDGIVTSLYDKQSLIGKEAAKIKNMNVYRSAISSSVVASTFELVQKKFYDLSYLGLIDDATLYDIHVNIRDTGASIPSVTPPLDLSMFTYLTPIFSPLLGTTCSAIYQERHILGLTSGYDNVSNTDGDMVVTAIGSTDQVASPAIYSNSRAFKMSIPTIDKSPVRQIISGEKLVVFSDEGAYIMGGGESGILTPTTINPIKMSSEGSSRFVSPLILRDNVIYLNTNHTKVMMVVFGPQGQAGVVELSTLSSHLLDGDEFIELKKVPGPEDLAIVLKQSGEAVFISVNEQNIAGFSTLDTEGGRIESATEFGDPTQNSVILSVIRNGIRFWETMGYHGRSNALRTQTFSDQTWDTGSRLLEASENGYPKIPALADNILEPKNFITYEYMNITTASDYAAGSTLTLTSAIQIGAGFIASDRIKHFFVDDDGKLAFLVLTLLDTGVGVGPYVYTARADIDIPVYLQDVENNAGLTDIEKLLITSRWLKAFTRVESIAGLDYQVGVGAIYLGLTEGATFDPLVVPAGEVEVAALGEGIVYSSPLNPYKNTLKIVKEAGQSPYFDYPELVTYSSIGVPYTSTMQTLPIETGDNRTLTDDKKIVAKVGIALYNTIGGYVGSAETELKDMAEIRPHDSVGTGTPDLGFSGYTDPTIPGEWTKDGMIKIVQVDPVPMTVLSVYPKGMAGD